MSDFWAHPLVDIARRAVEASRLNLVGREHNGMGVGGFVHYGAVGIDPKYLVVWVLLDGRPDSELPEWLLIGSDSDVPPDTAIGVGDYRWLQSLKAEIVRELVGLDWPSPELVTVIADSSHRVATMGGWHYFKG